MRYSFICALVLLPACIDMTPERFASLAELTSKQQEEGYVMVEHFGDGWPAEVLSERRYDDERVTVLLANSEAHTYDGQKGQWLKVIKLKREAGDGRRSCASPASRRPRRLASRTPRGCARRCGGWRAEG
jgi:hypothetical protein